MLYYVLHFGIIFVNNQLDAQFFFMYVYFFSYFFLNFVNLTEVFLTLTEVFPCFFPLSCKVNARIKLAKTGHGPYSS